MRRSCRCALALLLALQWWCCSCSQVDERLIGWLGETYQPGQQPLGGGAGMSVVSWDPRIFHFRHFLSDEECDHLRKTALPRLQKSGVSDAVTGVHKLDAKVRTSSGMFFERQEDEVVARVEQRVAAWTMLPLDNAEGMQVLHYARGEEYVPHHDYFAHPGRDDNGGNRLATVLMYLTDVEEGGETVFPHVARLPHQTTANGWSNCSQKGLALKPRKGDATLFWSIRPDGTFDYKSLHGSCPVIKGEKFSATKWIHVARFAVGDEKAKAVHRVIYAPPPPPVPAWCKDRHANCEIWAQSGECEANPSYMVGSKLAPGDCLVACGRCDLARPPTGAAASASLIGGRRAGGSGDGGAGGAAAAARKQRRRAQKR